MSRTIRNRPYLVHELDHPWRAHVDWPTCKCCSQKRLREWMTGLERMKPSDRRRALDEYNR